MTTLFPPVQVSRQSKRTFNPIRNVVDRLDITGNPDLPIIPLSIGDPTIFGNLSPHDIVVDSVRSVLDQGKHHGYPPSYGYVESRQAVADRYSTDQHRLTANDVILCSGGSSAIDLCLTALLDPADPVLIPNPGFSLYTTLSVSYQFNCCYYNLLPHRQWQIDLDHVQALIKEHGRIRVMIINNPSNPCGNVFSRDHCIDILRFAHRHQICIISDEIYAELVFHPDTKFHALGDLSEDVPVLSVGGLAKEFLVPGWRMGWILIHDRHQQLNDARKALISVSQMILGPNSLIQAALPLIFNRIPRSYFESLNATLRSHATICVEKLKAIQGLTCIPPSGALYLMVKIEYDQFRDIQDDVDFSQKLLREKSVFVLPGTAFRAFGFFRIVFCAPSRKLTEAFERIAEFCQDHRRAMPIVCSSGFS